MDLLSWFVVPACRLAARCCHARVPCPDARWFPTPVSGGLTVCVEGFALGRLERVQHHDRTSLGPIRMGCNRWSALPGDDVVRRVEGRVDPSTPRAPSADARQLELERLPVRVQDDMEKKALPAKLRTQGDAVRTVAPIGL